MGPHPFQITPRKIAKQSFCKVEGTYTHGILDLFSSKIKSIAAKIPVWDKALFIAKVNNQQSIDIFSQFTPAIFIEPGIQPNVTSHQRD